MTRSEAIAKLAPSFADEGMRDAVLTILGVILDGRRDRLSKSGGNKDFYQRASELIEASGGVIALEEAINAFLNLRQEHIGSIQSPSE